MTGSHLNDVVTRTTGIDPDDVDTSAYSWRTNSLALSRIKRKLEEAAPKMFDGFGNTDIAQAAHDAFVDAAAKVDVRREQMSTAATVLYQASTAMENARKAATDPPDAPGSPPKPDPYTGDSEEDEIRALKVYASKMQTYNNAVTAYGDADEKARVAVQALIEKYAAAVTVMKEIHGEPENDSPGGPGGSDGPGVRPPLAPVRPPQTPVRPPVVIGEPIPELPDPELPDPEQPEPEWPEPEWPEPPQPPEPPLPPNPQPPTPLPPGPGPDLPGAPGGPGGLGGPAVIGGAAAAAGALGAPGLANSIRSALGARGPLSGGGTIGSTTRAGGPGALGRGGAASAGSPVGRGNAAGARGGRAGAAAGGTGGRGGRGGAGAAGAAGRGGRGAGAAGAAGGRGRGSKDDEQGRDRDLFDDGQDWLDDEGTAPGVLD